MKWTDKGHQYDALGAKFGEVESLLVCGDDFSRANYYIEKPIAEVLAFLHVPVHELRIPKRWSRNKYLIYFLIRTYALLHGLNLKKTLILTQYSHADGEALADLTCRVVYAFKGCLVYDSVTFLERILPVFAIYARDKVYMRDCSQVITTKCTLNCKYCLNFTPFLAQGVSYDLDTLKKDIDTLFSTLDYIGFFQLTGGEPLLHPGLKTLIAWLRETHGAKIGQILFATNGTLVPDEDILEELKRARVLVLIDNYTGELPRLTPVRNRLMERLQAHGISFRDYAAGQQFFKFFPPAEDYSRLAPEQLADRADKCWGLQPWRTLKQGRIYFCNYAAFAETAGIVAPDARNSFPLAAVSTAQKRREFMEFVLGYSELGYDTFCLACNGIGATNTLPRSPAGEQARRKLSWRPDMTLAEFEADEAKAAPRA